MTELATAPAPAAIDTEATHEACCLSERPNTRDRITMCGLPIGDDEELGEDMPSCIVCRDLLERWAHYADTYGEDPTSPGDKPCRACPRYPEDGTE